MNRTFIIALIALSICNAVYTQDNKGKNCKTTDTATGSCTACNPGYFLAFLKPEESTNTVKTCEKCDCGYGNKGTCEDNKGCVSCSDNAGLSWFYFRQYRNPKALLSRRWSHCVKCSSLCFSSTTCVDHSGCSSCKTSYVRYTNKDKYQQDYYDCQIDPKKAAAAAGAVGLVCVCFFCVIPLVVLGLIIWCIVACVRSGSTRHTPAYVPQQPVQNGNANYNFNNQAKPQQGGPGYQPAPGGPAPGGPGYQPAPGQPVNPQYQ